MSRYRVSTRSTDDDGDATSVAAADDAVGGDQIGVEDGGHAGDKDVDGRRAGDEDVDGGRAGDEDDDGGRAGDEDVDGEHAGDEDLDGGRAGDEDVDAMAAKTSTSGAIPATRTPRLATTSRPGTARDWISRRIGPNPSHDGKANAADEDVDDATGFGAAGLGAAGFGAAGTGATRERGSRQNSYRRQGRQRHERRYKIGGRSTVQGRQDARHYDATNPSWGNKQDD